MKDELNAAVKAIDAEIARLTKIRDGLVAGLAAGGENPYPRRPGPKGKKKRVVSEATRKKMRAAWKRRKAKSAAKKAVKTRKT